MIEFVRRTASYQIQGYPDWMASLLYARGVQTKEEADAFLHPQESQFHDPFLLKDMDKAVILIRQAVQEKKRAVIYGDYDVDGVCASAILSQCFKSIGLKHVVYIPDRHTEGYGLNADALASFQGQADLVVTVDCGITAVQEVAYAKELGLQVIVTDHHTLGDMLPLADSVLSPLREGYPYPYLCGAGVAWKLSQALKGKTFALELLDLCCLATIADMVPLLDENRTIVALGLEKLSTSRRPGIVALKEVAGVARGQAVTADRVGFQLAPRLNASGRLETARAALDLLLTDSLPLARELAKELDSLNTRRRGEEQQVLKEAEETITDGQLFNRHSLVVVGDDWNTGVIGLAAGRLAEKYAYPTVCLSNQEGVCMGSARSAGGIHLYNALKECEYLFERFGGHEKAAGLSIKADKVETFREAFEEAIVRQLDGKELYPVQAYDEVWPLEQVTIEAIKSLEALAPFGIGNPSPAFLSTDLTVVSSRCVGSGQDHLKLVFEQANTVMDAIAFGKGDCHENLSPKLDAIYVPSINTFNGRTSPQIRVLAFRAGTQAIAPDQVRDEMQALEALKTAVFNGKDTADIKGPISPKDLPENLSRGTVILCRSRQTAQKMHELFSFSSIAFDLDQLDRRGYPVILVTGAVEKTMPNVRRLILADGLIHPKEWALMKAAFPNAEIFCLASSQAVESLLKNVYLSVDELREVYKSYYSGQKSDLNLLKDRAGVYILIEVKLLWRDEGGRVLPVLPIQKTDPTQSLIYQTLLSCKEGTWHTQHFTH